MVKNRSAAPGSVIPTLVYKDVGQAIFWLCETFGFTERFHYGTDDKISGAQLAVGEGSIFLVAPRISEDPDRIEFRPPRKDETSHSIDVRIGANIDAHYQYSVERGARILNHPATYPFGERQYTVEDLEGHRWTFTQSVADVSPEEWGGKTSRLQVNNFSSMPE